jgi:threonine aldolase
MTTHAAIVDLRSDTVTRPTAAMGDAIRSAPLGDDVLGDEPTVAKLEQAIAKRSG